MLKLRVRALFFILLPVTAAAQMSPSNPGGFNNTDPRSPAYNQGLAAPPTPASEQWADRWGAIASDGNGESGIVTEFNTKAEAQRGAVVECQKRGGQGCKAVFVFRNQCAAVISDRIAGSLSASAAYEGEAVNKGVAKCKGLGGAQCRVFWSGCSLGVRVD